MSVDNYKKLEKVIERIEELPSYSFIEKEVDGKKYIIDKQGGFLIVQDLVFSFDPRKTDVYQSTIGSYTLIKFKSEKSEGSILLLGKETIAQVDSIHPYKSVVGMTEIDEKLRREIPILTPWHEIAIVAEIHSTPNPINYLLIPQQDRLPIGGEYYSLFGL